MACSQLPLQSVQPHIGFDNLTNILESNLKMYYDFALLCIGGWSDVTISTSGAYGGDYSWLRLVDDPNYTLGQVWQAARKDFVWEQDIDYINTSGTLSNPLVVGVPVVDNIPTNQSYYINYPQGQVIFNYAQSASSNIYLSYSYRYVQIYKADAANWWHELQFNSHRVDSEQFTSTEGDWWIFGEHRVQMPAVVIEAVPKGSSKGWELGSSSQIASRDIMIHVFAESYADCRNLADIFSFQSERTIQLFDTNTVSVSGAFPLDYRGELLANNHYNNLIASYPWRKCRIVDSTISHAAKIHPRLYTSDIRITTEIIV